MFKAVLFDMDGTLIDASEAIAVVVAETIKELTGKDVPHSEIKKLIGRPIWEFFEELSPEIEITSKEASAIYRKKYDKVAESMTKLIPYAKDALEKVKSQGLKVGIVSQRPTKLIYEILDYMDLRDFVDVVTSGEETKPKPAPDALIKAAELLELNPSEIMFVGDATFDVVAAKKAGMHTVGVLTGVGTKDTLEAAGADIVLENLKTLNLDK